MNYDMPKVFHEALALHLILQAGDVRAEDIYVTPVAFTEEGKRDQLGVVVMEKGVQVYAVAVGPVGMTRAEFKERWPMAVAKLKTMTDAEATEFRDSAEVRERATQVLLALCMGRSDPKARPKARKSRNLPS